MNDDSWTQIFQPLEMNLSDIEKLPRVSIPTNYTPPKKKKPADPGVAAPLASPLNATLTETWRSNAVDVSLAIVFFITSTCTLTHTQCCILFNFQFNFNSAVWYNKQRTSFSVASIERGNTTIVARFVRDFSCFDLLNGAYNHFVCTVFFLSSVSHVIGSRHRPQKWSGLRHSSSGGA